MNNNDERDYEQEAYNRSVNVNDPTEWHGPAATVRPTPSPIPTRRKRRWVTHTVWAAVSLAALGLGALAGGGGTGTPATATAGGAALPAPTVTVTTHDLAAAPVPAATVKPTPTPKPKPVKATIPDGDSVVVGTDIPPGRYDARSASDACYWEIDKHATSDIVDNDLGKRGHLVVTLKRGQDFSSSDCGDWTQE